MYFCGIKGFVMSQRDSLIGLINRYKELGIDSQIDYEKFYLYSLITHSTAIEGSTVTELENQLLFDEGISAKGKPLIEQPKFVIDPGEMDQCTQLGFTHFKTTATEGMKMLLEAFKEL